MILQLVVSGLAVGSLYAMVAIGFSLLWQTSRTVNFAQGEWITVPAFTAVILIHFLKVPLSVAVILAVLISVLVLGYAFRKTLIERLVPAGVIPLVVATIALSIVIRNSFVFYNAESIPFPSIFSQEPIRYAGMVFRSLDVWNMVFAASVIIGLQIFIKRTKIGKAMQAVAQNREAARIVGINAKRIITWVFVINAFLAAIAAILIALIYLVTCCMGVVLSPRALRRNYRV
jgi:branched-chain amino acid transport system permease protein